MRKSLFVLSIINAILLMGCNRVNITKQISDLPALPDELQVGLSVLSQDRQELRPISQRTQRSRRTHRAPRTPSFPSLSQKNEEKVAGVGALA